MKPYFLFSIISCLMAVFFPFITLSSVIITGSDNQSWTINAGEFTYRIFVDKEQQVRTETGEELPVRGGKWSTISNTSYTPQLEVIFADKVRDIELVYDRYEIIKEKDGHTVLVIWQKDKYYPLSVAEYIRPWTEYNLIEKWTEVINTGKKDDILVENIQSGNIFLDKDEYQLTHYAGVWGHEFQPYTVDLTPGVKTLEVKFFHGYTPSVFMVKPKSDITGKIWFGSVCYSGNWRLDFDKAATGRLQIVGGVNFWDQSLTLKPGNQYTTPKIIFGYTEQGMEGVSLALARFTREQLLPQNKRDKIRPVLYNSWYATEFNVNEEQQVALAKVAKELGVEMFVIDDGWFKGRVNDKGGLGDWSVDTNKFPNGLGHMIKQINDLGMDFGLWIEPEMVNPNSDLFRAHPDWAYYYPNRIRHQTRNQYMLNLAREDVYNYLLNSYRKLLRENNIKYIKWDRNRGLSDVGYPSAPFAEQHSVRIRHIENLYRLIDTLRAEFPDVWFENCAGGGGRIDHGMLSHMDFCWTSDNTDPVERIFIHDSYLQAFPANTMICWITQEDWHQLNFSLQFKLDVAMAGVLGIGYDITKWNAEERTVARKKIEEYKQIRPIVQFGDAYRLESPYTYNRSIIQYIDRDQTSAVLFVYNLAAYPDNAVPDTRRNDRVLLKGLNKTSEYMVEGLGQFTGEQLMHDGLSLKLSGAYKSQIIKIKKM